MQSTLCYIGCSKLGGPIASDALRELDSVSGCLESFWVSIRSSYDAGHIQQAAAQLLRRLDRVPQIGVDHLTWLQNSGYSREDVRQIRYVVEVFCCLEPVFILFSSLATRWLSNAFPATRQSGSSSTSRLVSVPYSDSIEMLSGQDDLSCVASLATRHGKPVHSFFRALAIWPEYARLACRQIAVHEYFSQMSRNIGREAQLLASTIPIIPSQHPLWLDTESMKRSMQQCSDASCDVIAAVAILKNGFIVGEESQRDRWGAIGGVGRAC